MRFLLHLAVLFYGVVVFILCLAILAFVLNIVPLQDVTNRLEYIYSDEHMRLILGIAAFVIMLVNHLFLKTLSDRQQRRKTYAFDNPSGRVSVSLTVMEDLVRRAILEIPEVKEVRTAITIKKKVFNIESGINLGMDVNIPEMTSRLQELVKKKVQNTVGLDMDIVVRVHIARLVTHGKAKQNKQEESDDEMPTSTFPFQGYRA